MGRTFRRLFSLRRGEGFPLTLFGLLGFLWSIGAYGGWTLSEGMFLEHVGSEHLPGIYFAIAFGMFAVSALLLFALGRLKIHHLLLMILSGSAATYLCLFSLLTLSSGEVPVQFWYIFRTLGHILPISCFISFWAFIDQYYELQSSKRLFCLFNSILFLGDATGGTLVSIGYSRFGISGIMLLFGLLITLSLPFLFVIVKKLRPLPEDHQEGVLSVSKCSLKDLALAVLRSRFTLLLMFVYFIMQLLSIITEYSYTEALERFFPGNDGSLSATEFLGRATAWVSIGNMLFGLFFYSRLVRRIGVNNIILIAPLFFLSVFAFWSFQDLLILTLFGIIAQEGMVYTFDDNNLNLLINGVPTRVKNHVRITIESFFEPAGMLASACLLLFFRSQSKVLGLLLSFVGLVVTLSLRAHYPKAIFRNIIDGGIRFTQSIKEQVSRLKKQETKSMQHTLLVTLKHGSENKRLLAFDWLLQLERIDVLPKLLHQLGRFSIRGKLQAIGFLDESVFATEMAVFSALDRLARTTPHPLIQNRCALYLARHRLIPYESLLERRRSQSLTLRASGIFTILTQCEESSLLYQEAYQELLALLHSQNEEENQMAIKLLGWKKRGVSPAFLLPFLSSKNDELVCTTSTALREILQPQHQSLLPDLQSMIPQVHPTAARCHLIEALFSINAPTLTQDLLALVPKLRPSERKKIERLLFRRGAKDLAVLEQALRDPNHASSARLLAAKLLRTFAPGRLKKPLLYVVRQETEKAYFYYYHASTIHQQLPSSDLSLLEQTLMANYESIVDFLIQLIGFSGSLREGEVLAHALACRSPKVRAHALESLEKGSDQRAYALLAPLLDHNAPHWKIRHYLHLGHAPYTLSQLIGLLAISPSRVNQIVADTLQSRFSETLPSLKPLQPAGVSS